MYEEAQSKIITCLSIENYPQILLRVVFYNWFLYLYTMYLSLTLEDTIAYSERQRIYADDDEGDDKVAYHSDS